MRALALLSEDEASLRSPDGTVAGYEEALRAAGFTTVNRVDLAAAGARAVVNDELRAAKAAKERVCIHCADGTAMTSIVMCDWLLMDYIGGDNCEEASETLRARKRLGGAPPPRLPPASPLPPLPPPGRARVHARATAGSPPRWLTRPVGTRASPAHAGVERFADAEVVANYIVAGQTGVVPPDEDDGPSDEDITVSPGGILLL